MIVLRLEDCFFQDFDNNDNIQVVKMYVMFIKSSSCEILTTRWYFLWTKHEKDEKIRVCGGGVPRVQTRVFVTSPTPHVSSVKTTASKLVGDVVDIPFSKR